MAAAHLLPAEQQSITVEEYLGTPYDPDCDYADGRVEERNTLPGTPIVIPVARVTALD
ncbi:hypothetical protein [Terriglobus tenax]|uniref:hypothetical protein n=1 Tax=Terriglobus tenax TaxID=1111115 RepID=UPI0021E05905|nr:hypothetical protein [Terriglobus tenax]